MACLAAYLFLVLLGVINSQVWAGSYRGSYSDLFFGAPLFVLVLSSWFVLPALIVIGGAAGLAIPYLAGKQTRHVVVYAGLGMGVLIGIIGGVFNSYEVAGWEAFSFSRGIDNAAWWASFWRNVRWQCPLTSLYAMAWTGTYAHLRAKRSSSKQYL